ncbi:CDP-glucose 4,6-dehydratase [Oscillatoria amoena NRMC-F 0135]|nr:CDP-glucose 4,6-dehydratase [Geitlerinema splendidum]MDL5046860.1 CDP-glucose 4,6-dehydratase [Oscillatoria amoena NRMC-F 0135]
MKPSSWPGKRVFLTGHTGFKGSWLSLWLQLLGAEVAGYSLAPPTQPSLFELADVQEGMLSIEGDIRDLERLRQAIAQFKPEIVFHLAAQSIVRQSYQNPVDTYAVNVMGTVNLLEAIRQVGGVRAVVNITSDKCYENREWVWGYRENEAMGGYDPYSSSKGCAELVTSAYRNSFFHPSDYAQHGVAIASARAGNVIGGGDWAVDRLIPDTLKSLIAKQPLPIRNPHAIRPWQHVLEPLNGYLTLAEYLYQQGAPFSEAWNFGPNDCDIQPVSWVVDRLFTLWGEGTWQWDRGTQPHEATTLKLDSTKARIKLGWQPKLDLETALAWIVDWTKAWQAGANSRHFTETQIQKFMEIGGI